MIFDKMLRSTGWNKYGLLLLIIISLTHFKQEKAVAQEINTEGTPNVVLIMTDDQGYGDFSRHGNTVIKTPYMDRLAEESIRFTDFHVASVCTPTRGQLLTGLDALRNGAISPHGQRHVLKRGLPTIGDIFLSNGYKTALYGKWHLGGNFLDFMPHERGFGDAVWFLRGGVQSSPNYWNSDLMYDILYYNNGEQNVEQKQFPGYATDVWFDLGTRFIRESKKNGKPFFLYLPLNAPHAPLLVPDHYREPYKHLNKETATFFGMIASVDYRLGEFISMLEQEGLRDNTILIFLTDNGTANRPDNVEESHQPEYYNAGMRGRKGSRYEGGHRVPLFISWPGGDLREPTDVDELTHVQDILPTLIDLAGLQWSSDIQLDGISLAPLLRGESQPELANRILVAQKNQDSVEGPFKGPATVMWRKWRLVEGNELYNVKQDPGQEVNVIGRYPEIAEQLQDHYDRWWEGIEPHLDLEPYRIAVDHQTMLTAYDWWYGQRVYNWWHLRRGDKSTGRYEVVVDESGEYRVSLRRWPRESGAGIRDSVPRYIPFDTFRAFDTYPPGKALNISRACVRFGDQERTLPVSSEDQEVTFTFQLPEGETDLQTWFITEEGEKFGAYYVYIEGLSQI